MNSRCFQDQISKYLYAKQTLSWHHHVRFRTVNFKLHTCCWEPHALPLHMSLNLPHKVLFTTTKKKRKKKKNFNPSKFHSRDSVIASLHSFWKTMLLVPSNTCSISVLMKNINIQFLTYVNIISYSALCYIKLSRSYIILQLNSIKLAKCSTQCFTPTPDELQKTYFTVKSQKGILGSTYQTTSSRWTCNAARFFHVYEVPFSNSSVAKVPSTSSFQQITAV